jgi:hypothetical protein
MRRVVGLAPLLVLLLATVAGAAVVEEIARDFKSLSGYVIMPAQGEFLLDMDADNGVVAGDLFSVVKAGEKVVHPVTGEVLGTLDEVKGLLQVTRVKSGYSYARPVGEVTGVEAGDQVRRYGDLRAAFWDYTEGCEALFAELKAALPALEWQDYAAAQSQKPQPASAPAKAEAALLFVLRDDGLEVRDAAFRIIHAYSSPVPAKVPAAPTMTAPATSLDVSPPGASGIVAAPAASVAPGTNAILRQGAQTREGIWVGPVVEDSATSIEVADFDGDGRLETAIGYPHKVVISRLEGSQYLELATIDVGLNRNVLRLDGTDLDGDGKAELYVTAASGLDPASLVILAGSGRYRIVQEWIPRCFRAVSLPGEGRVLLVQKLGNTHEDFVGPVFRVRQSDGKVIDGEPLSIPGKLGLYSFLPISAEGGAAFVNLSPFDFLQVLSADGEKLWESAERLGGSETYIERIDSTKPVQERDNIRHLYLSARLEQGEQGEILVPFNEGSRLFARARSFDKSRLMAMKWDGRELREVWHTREQRGYLADYRLADVDNDGSKEAVLAAVTGSGLGGKRKSSIFVYELR